MWYLLVFIPCAVWMFVDSQRRRYAAGKWWSIATAVFGPITGPIYLASRPLRKGETREGGRAWNILKNFALFWTVTMAVCTIAGMINVAGSASELSNEYERAGAAVGTAIGLGLLFCLWFFPMVGALVVGVFLKKSAAVETGPTGPLATQDEADYKLSDLAVQVKSASQVAATRAQALASEIKERASSVPTEAAGNRKGPADLLKRAKYLIANGRRDEAIAALKDIVAFFPDSPEASAAAASLKRAGVTVD